VSAAGASNRATHQRLLIVTRPQAQALPWVRDLQVAGLRAEALPLIAISPVADPAPLLAAWQRLREYSLLMFVSANAVWQFFSWRPKEAAWPVGLRAGATGPGTSAALMNCGVPSACIVQPAADAATLDSEALWAQLKDDDWQGCHVLVVRGEDGRDWLADTLRDRGAVLSFVAAYQRVVPTLNEQERALLALAITEPAQHLWLFSSSQAVAHLCSLAPDAQWQRSMAVASHPRIAQAACEAGFGSVTVVAPSLTAMAQALARLADTEPPIESAPRE
jgi:uroporphyrinogen-III synthase